MAQEAAEEIATSGRRPMRVEMKLSVLSADTGALVAGMVLSVLQSLTRGSP